MLPPFCTCPTAWAVISSSNASSACCLHCCVVIASLLRFLSPRAVPIGGVWGVCVASLLRFPSDTTAGSVSSYDFCLCLKIRWVVVRWRSGGRLVPQVLLSVDTTRRSVSETSCPSSWSLSLRRSSPVSLLPGGRQCLPAFLYPKVGCLPTLPAFETQPPSVRVAYRPGPERSCEVIVRFATATLVCLLSSGGTF